MKKVFIKYNPYKLETEITIDGKALAQNSSLREKSANGSRLQDWIEELPQTLVEEYNDIDFNVTFYGTLLDYEDLTSVFDEAKNDGKINVEYERNPAKETTDKEALIDDVFKEIQKGPFEELRNEKIISAFDHARSSDFEICVVATMSAGKSTLINSLLGSKLMPSKQEACTAIITRIKDVSTEDIPFRAEVYDKENILTETLENLTLDAMNRLNADDTVSVIKVMGNIPFVSSEDVSLVLIDTPGPNNSRDPRHKKIQSELLSKSSKSLILYIMTGEFGTDDDNSLLTRVAESMAVGGKQSKDRFIFVINKMDNRKKEDGDTEQTLEKIRSYLKTHGIENPNLFPAAAEPALNMRRMMNGADIDEDTADETEGKVKKLNRNDTLHLEKYATLPASLRGEINNQLYNVRSCYDGQDIKNAQEALIHTGVVSIEVAIRQYIQKYAKTAKIKNIVDTFMANLDELDCIEETKRTLAQNIDEGEKIVQQIASIRKKIDDAKDAINFKNTADETVNKMNDEFKKVVDRIIVKFQILLTKRLDDLRDKELGLEEADYEKKRLQEYAKKLEPDFEVELNQLIDENLVKTGHVLVEEYKKKLASLTSEVNSENLGDFKIDPLKLMSGSSSYNNISIENLIETKDVKDFEKWGAAGNDLWSGVVIWFDEIGLCPVGYKTVKFVPGNELAQKVFTPLEQALFTVGNDAKKHAMLQSKRIAELFNLEFNRLDSLLKAKLTELESYATDKEKADERIRETERNLSWLEEIKSKVESILEI